MKNIKTDSYLQKRWVFLSRFFLLFYSENITIKYALILTVALVYSLLFAKQNKNCRYSNKQAELIVKIKAYSIF